MYPCAAVEHEKPKHEGSGYASAVSRFRFSAILIYFAGADKGQIICRRHSAIGKIIVSKIGANQAKLLENRH
jgi:hypothetical protein